MDDNKKSDIMVAKIIPVIEEGTYSLTSIAVLKLKIIVCFSRYKNVVLLIYVTISLNFSFKWIEYNILKIKILFLHILNVRLLPPCKADLLWEEWARKSGNN